MTQVPPGHTAGTCTRAGSTGTGARSADCAAAAEAKREGGHTLLDHSSVCRSRCLQNKMYANRSTVAVPEHQSCIDSALQAVLVGDPMQLPATVLSSKAQRHHLAQSLFERLQRVRSHTPLAHPPLTIGFCEQRFWLGLCRQSTLWHC